MTTLIIATRNAHKVREIQAVLSDQFTYHTLDDFPAAPPVLEDATTFVGNASKKALGLAQWLAVTPHATSRSAIFCLADDSGLEVDALQGAPGVHSARFAALDTPAAGNSSDQANNDKLLRCLAQVPPSQRTARFRCVIALAPVPVGAAQPLPSSAGNAAIPTQTFEGACEGHIIAAPRGNRGFGYDPLFVPNGYDQTFAELGDEVKNQISHRARGLLKLREWLLAAGRETDR